jgi:hypothetical protein
LTGNPGAGCTNTSPSAVGAFNDSRTGGGFGVSANIPVFAKKVDFGVKGVAGNGIARYGAAQLADITFRPDGTQALIRTAHGLARVEIHPTPKLDVYLYYGGEYAFRAAYTGYLSDAITTSQAYSTTACVIGTPGCPASGFITTATTITTHKTSTSGIGGYGSPFANNTNCGVEAVPSGSSAPGSGSCAGDIRLIQEGTVGFWHKVYQGPKGGFRWGLQYSYLTKGGWSGAASVSPKAIDNIIETSFRYYLP